MTTASVPGTFTVATTMAARTMAGDTTQNSADSVKLTDSRGMSSPRKRNVKCVVESATAGITYAASGLPAGLSISAAGVISGTATTRGTSPITIHAAGTFGASANVIFVWTIT